jgi:predicted ATP-grasp superfamily ATP-dependent carboligase/ubiquinone/menaquinone biosynthesis C-methylase UbiE
MMGAGTIGSTHHHRPDGNRPAKSSYFRSVAGYWAKLYEDHDLTARIYQERKNVTLEWIKEIQLPAGASVLDLGCGAGYTTMALAQQGYKVSALDCEQAMLDMTAGRVQAAGVSALLALGDAHELQFDDRTFDLVLALGVIPWLHSPHIALREMRRVLKPGGFLIVSSDNSERLNHWLDPTFNPVLTPFRKMVASALRNRGWMQMPDTTPPMMQAPREFDRWLERAGFEKVQSTTVGFGPFTFLRRIVLPDRMGIKTHGMLQRLAHRKWPLVRSAGSHYLVAARNPEERSQDTVRWAVRAGVPSESQAAASDVSTPVVVLGANTHGSLGIMRSLGRVGISVHAVYSPPRGPASFSGYCKTAEAWDFSHARAEETVSYLLELAQRIGKQSILIPTWDEMAVFAAEHFEILKTGFIYPQQPASLARSLCSKKEMAGLARQCGVATPEVVFPRSLNEVEQYIETARFPVMLKGIDGNRLKERTGKKMVIVYSPRQLRQMYAEMEDAEEPNLMLQEYIPGGDDSIWMFNGYFNESSECLAGFTGRKLRQTPIHTGMTSLGVCLRNEVVERTTKEFMRALGYRGILDIGYRFDPRDGKYKVLDINPRIGATFRLFVAENGMDVARVLYLDMTGQHVPPCRQREGRKWFVESDLKSCLDYYREGSLTIRQWLGSLHGIEEAGYFAQDDMTPFWKLGSRVVSDAASQVRRSLRAAHQATRRRFVRFIESADAKEISITPENGHEEAPSSQSSPQAFSDDPRPTAN